MGLRGYVTDDKTNSHHRQVVIGSSIFLLHQSLEFRILINHLEFATQIYGNLGCYVHIPS